MLRITYTGSVVSDKCGCSNGVPCCRADDGSGCICADGLVCIPGAAAVSHFGISAGVVSNDLGRLVVSWRCACCPVCCAGPTYVGNCCYHDCAMYCTYYDLDGSRGTEAAAIGHSRIAAVGNADSAGKLEIVWACVC